MQAWPLEGQIEQASHLWQVYEPSSSTQADVTWEGDHRVSQFRETVWCRLLPFVVSYQVHSLRVLAQQFTSKREQCFSACVRLYRGPQMRTWKATVDIGDEARTYAICCWSLVVCIWPRSPLHGHPNATVVPSIVRAAEVGMVWHWYLWWKRSEYCQVPLVLLCDSIGPLYLSLTVLMCINTTVHH